MIINKRIVTYSIIKYIIFYVILMIKNNDYYLVKPGLSNASDLLYYLWVFGLLPILYLVLFYFPLKYALNETKGLLFFMVIMAVFIIEYILYTNIASTMNLANGVINAATGIALFVIFFQQIIRSKY